MTKTLSLSVSGLREVYADAVGYELEDESGAEEPTCGY